MDTQQEVGQVCQMEIKVARLEAQAEEETRRAVEALAWAQTVEEQEHEVGNGGEKEDGKNHAMTAAMAALAAEAAEDRPRALIMAAPRCCTVGMNSLTIQSLSTSEVAALPATWQ